MGRSVQITVQQQAQVQRVGGADSQVASGHGISTAPDISDAGEEDCETEFSGEAHTAVCIGKKVQPRVKRERELVGRLAPLLKAPHLVQGAAPDAGFS